MGKKIRINSTEQCDVLIIGGGGAGLRCAVEIFEKRPGTKVVVVTKVGHVKVPYHYRSGGIGRSGSKGSY